MQRRLVMRLMTLFLVMLAFGTACEKKRKARYVQGDGEFVYVINEYKGATFTLTTGKKRTPGVATHADELNVNPGTSAMRSYDSVEFDLKTEIGEFSNTTMNNFDFYGKENSEYKIQTDFTEGNFVFFKVAKKDELPTNELTYAEDIGNGLYRVPLFGLPLDKVTVEPVLDDRGKATNQVRTVPKKFLSEATHFLVNVNAPKYMESQLKLDMLPASFFDENNEWFYDVTIVDKPIALTGDVELGYELTSGKAKFSRTNNSVLAVDLNIPDEAAGQDADKLDVVFEIPVQWMDYRLVKTGDDAYLKEEAFDSIDKGAKFWKDRQYALLQLDRVLSIDAASTNNIKIKRLEVSDDYLSFVIYDSLTKISYDYAFSKKNQSTPGKVYPREDARKFGFFESTKQLFGGILNESEQTVSRAVIQNRMRPENNEIVFHITENTPQDPIFLDAIGEALKGWDQTFVEAAKGTKYEANPIRIKFDPSVPVKNGDVRYNKVSFYPYEVESGLLGYGPSTSDNRNGEIYSATNHIYLRNYREDIIRNLTNYIRYKVGAYSGLGIDGITTPNQILAIDTNSGFDFSAPVAVGGDSVSEANGLTASLPGAASSLQSENIDWNAILKTPIAKTTNVLTAGARAKAAALANMTPAEGDSLYKTLITARKKMENGLATESDFHATMKMALKQKAKVGQTCDVLAGTSLTFKEIEDVCGSSGTEFSDYVKSLQDRVAAGENIYRLDTERTVLLNCAQKMMKPALIATLAHEFGHDFGLRHNFAGSSDAANFARNADGTPISRLSSVMDYSHGDADRGYVPGPYDVAAIRYGYYDAVEAKDKSTGESKIVDIASADATKDYTPIETRLAAVAGNGVELRKFSYCTDEDIVGDGYSAQVPTENPNCQRWDQGSDPVTKTRSAIDTFVTTLVTQGNRFDLEYIASSGGLASGAALRYINDMQNIYNKYRFTLYNTSKAISAQTGQLQDDPYFDTTTEEATERLVLGDEYDKATAIVAELRANPQMSTEEVEKRVLPLKEVTQGKIASEIYKDFLLETIFAEANYCVALRANGAAYDYLDVEPLSTVRAKNFSLTGQDSSRCEDMGAYFAKKLATNGNATTTVDRVVSVGNPYDYVWYSANPDLLSLRQPVRTGLSEVRTYALGFLAPRVASSFLTTDVATGLIVSAAADFYPSLLDGESFRAAYLDKMRDRITNGVQVQTIANYAQNKLTKLDRKAVAVNVAKADATRSLPFYQEEKILVENAWFVYRAGVQSPRSTSSAKVASVIISALPYDNFIGFGGDQRYSDYLVSADNTAYFTNGAAAGELIRAYNDSDNTLQAIAQKKSMLTNAKPQTQLDAFDDKVTDVVSGFFVASKKLGDRYHSINDVLYQVRVCVENTLVKEFALNKNNFSTLLEQADPSARFSTAAYCEAPRGDNEKEMADFETKYTDQARAYLKYMADDKKSLNSTTVESILNLIGLPSSPDEAEDPTVTLQRIFKSQQQLNLDLVGYAHAGDTLSSLEYNTVLKAIDNIQAGLSAAPGTAVPSIKSAVQAARVAEFAEIQLNEPFVTHLNDKLQVLRDLIFN